jgi:hypothetical protein
MQADLSRVRDQLNASLSENALLKKQAAEYTSQVGQRPDADMHNKISMLTCRSA